MISSYSSSHTTFDIGCPCIVPCCLYFLLVVLSNICYHNHHQCVCELRRRESEEEEGPGLPWEPGITYQDKWLSLFDLPDSHREQDYGPPGPQAPQELSCPGFVVEQLSQVQSCEAAGFLRCSPLLLSCWHETALIVGMRVALEEDTYRVSDVPFGTKSSCFHPWFPENTDFNALSGFNIVIHNCQQRDTMSISAKTFHPGVKSLHLLRTTHRTEMKMFLWWVPNLMIFSILLSVEMTLCQR